MQVSLDGATPEVNDFIRGPRSYETALRAMANLSDAGMRNFKLSVVCTRQNIPQLDEFKAIADRYGAQLRLTRLRPSGRGADVWDELHPTREQQRELYDWLVAHGDEVLTGDSFFHLSAYGQALPGLNLCGAGRVVCLIDPIGDVYACPFAIHEEFLAGNVRDDGGFRDVWRESELFTRLRSPQSGGACSSCQFFDTCKGGCMAAKFFTGPAARRPRPRVRAGVRRRAARESRGRTRDPEALGRPLAPHGARAAVGHGPGAAHAHPPRRHLGAAGQRVRRGSARRVQRGIRHHITGIRRRRAPPGRHPPRTRVRPDSPDTTATTRSSGRVRATRRSEACPNERSESWDCSTARSHWSPEDHAGRAAHTR